MQLTTWTSSGSCRMIIFSRQRRLLAAILKVAVAFCLSSLAAGGGLQVGYYYNKCRGFNVEALIYNSMLNSILRDRTVAPGVLRLAFHDCFVRGCDASLLLDTPNAEKSAAINGGLHGYEAIDAAKAAVETACGPGVVSCADILQFSARDSVKLTGGQGWDVPSGRKDGTISNSAEPTQELPSPFMKVPQLLTIFQKKGLNAAQMVALSGSHTIGIAHCPFVTNRIYTFSSPSGSDPSLPVDFLTSLKLQCPSSSATNALPIDQVSPGTFDSQYFQNIIKGRGLLTSDQSLLEDSRTKGEVFANSGPQFGGNFGRAMQAMSQIGVLTGNVGQIRTNCRQVL